MGTVAYGRTPAVARYIRQQCWPLPSRYHVLLRRQVQVYRRAGPMAHHCWAARSMHAARGGSDRSRPARAAVSCSVTVDRRFVVASRPATFPGAMSNVRNEKAAKIWIVVLTVLTVGLVVVFFRKPPDSRSNSAPPGEGQEPLMLRHAAPAAAGSHLESAAFPLSDALPPGRERLDPLLPTELSAGQPVARRSWESARDLRLFPSATTLPDRNEKQRDVSYHRIVDGDSLAGLAEQYLGDPARAEEIFAANREVLPSREVLPLGARLVIPCARRWSRKHRRGSARIASDRMPPLRPRPFPTRHPLGASNRFQNRCQPKLRAPRRI